MIIGAVRALCENAPYGIVCECHHYTLPRTTTRLLYVQLMGLFGCDVPSMSLLSASESPRGIRYFP